VPTIELLDKEYGKEGTPTCNKFKEEGNLPRFTIT